MSELTVVTAAIDSPEWLELLIKAVKKFSVTDPDLIVIDNGSLVDNLRWVRYQDTLTLHEAGRNLGHGGAMDLGTELARSKYVCFLDIDSHPMREGWDRELIDLYEANPETRLIGCIGPDHKPLHPPLFFYEKRYILDNGLTFKYIPNNPRSTDTAQKVFWDVQDLGFDTIRLSIGAKTYGCIGDEIHINDKSTIYHHWYGTRFCENNPEKRRDKLDGYTLDAHLANKAALFDRPEVKDILTYGPDIKFRDYEKCRREMRSLGGRPWIELGAIEMLEAALTKDSVVLEVGAGSSTAWLAERAGHVVSFEHNELWYNIVKDEIDLRGLKNVILRHEPNYPENGLPEIKGQYDVVFVDGPTEGRNNPVEVGIKHLKPGGLLILDDSQRTELYGDGLAALEKTGWDSWDFNVAGYVRHTSVWRSSK
jgi:precorrin-6B methylase 2